MYINYLASEHEATLMYDIILIYGKTKRKEKESIYNHSDANQLVEIMIYEIITH